LERNENIKMKTRISNTILISKTLAKLKKLGCVVAFILLYSNSSAQEIKATASLDSNTIKIGQQTQLKLSIRYRVDKGKQSKIQWPEINDTIRKEIEVVGQSKLDTIIPDKNKPTEFIQTKTLYITSFDSGFWAIPPLKFILNSDTNGIFTVPLLLHVGGISVDTTIAIKDIKPPFGQSYSFIDWLKDNMYVVWGSLIAILITIIIIYMNKRFKKVPPPMITIESPKIPAHVIAYEKLEKLKGEKLWQEGKMKLYYSRLTDIVREYIENRFKIQALEQTTDEIIVGFRNVAIDEESKTKLKQVLVLSDLVKFAKEQPTPSENEMCLENSYAFISGTKKEEELIQNK